MCSYNTETLNFNDIDEVLELGHKLFSSEVYKEAARCYTTAIVSISISSVIYTYITYIEYLWGKSENNFVGRGDSLKIMFRLFQNERSEMAKYYRWRGHCYWKMNQLEAAIKDLEVVLQKIDRSSPLIGLSSTDCEMDLAEILFEAREYTRAKNGEN